MTVRTEKAKVDPPVVVINPVNVVQFKAEWRTSPVRDPTNSTIVTPATPQKSLDNSVTTRFRRILDKNLFITPPNAASVLGDARAGLLRQALCPALTFEMICRDTKD